MSTTSHWFERLRSHGLGLPEAVEEFPWGHSALKVRGKTFLFLNASDEELSLSVKLPVSRDFALIFDWPSRPATALVGAAESLRVSSRGMSRTSIFSNAGP